MCFLFMYALSCCVLLHISVTPTLALSALLISLNNAMFSDPIYKIPLPVIIWLVQISTLILILIVYLTSLWSSKLPNLSFQTSWIIHVNSRCTLALFSTSMLTSLDYAHFQIDLWTPRQLLKLLDNLRTSTMHLKYLDVSSGQLGTAHNLKPKLETPPMFPVE